jgi:tricorn protease
MNGRILSLLLAAFSLAGPLFAAEPMRLAKFPALSPDGALVAFEWNGDLWVARSGGGEARQLTTHPGKDSQPKFSPEGGTIAFLSDRDNGSQVFTVPVSGGAPQQLTYHTAGYDQLDWAADGKRLIVKATRDFFWKHGERFFMIDAKPRPAETLVFDDYGTDAQLSPDGKKILFTREAEPWWRKGYQGSRASQVWLFDVERKSFDKILHKSFGCRWPMWRSDGRGFYYVEENAQGSNLFAYDLSSKASTPLTTFKTDSVVFPGIARDGSLIVFRHLFDLYSYAPATKALKKLDLFHNADRIAKRADSRLLATATAAAFSNDGLEIAFIAGGDLWVMDTELREPIQVTRTAADEKLPLFLPDGQSLLFTQPLGSKFAIAKATRADPKKFWWQNTKFNVERLAEFDDVPSQLKLSPTGKKLAYLRGPDLWIADLDLTNAARVLSTWSTPEFDWSPDGEWLVYAADDSDFNREIWIMPAAGGKAVNISRHPFNEGHPVWSPDGKMVAFTGQRASTENAANIALVYLKAEDDDKTARDRKLEKALDKMKTRTNPAKGPKADGDKVDDKKAEAKKGVAIDFEGLPERVRRVSLGEGSASALFWSPDSKKLAFTGNFEGKPGTYAIDVADSLTPKPLTTTVGAQPTWLKQGNQIVWLVAGVPTSTPGVAAPAAAAPTAPAPTPAAKVPLKKGGGKGAAAAAPAFAGAPSGGGSYTFAVRQDLDLPGRNAAAFDECWRVMRDRWYDGRLNNRDWNEVRAKYLPAAREAPDADTLSTVVHMMLGELNGSHLGFTSLAGEISEKKGPRDITPHLGVRFDQSFAAGLKVADVLPGGPADKPRSKLRPGEIIQKVNGTPVSLNKDLTTILNGPIDRELVLTVEDAKGDVRDVGLRPITYAAAQPLLYEQWMERSRKAVKEASSDKFGYLHISQMSMPTFRKFEEDLIAQAWGKDGLVIDVRENPGGSTADHLLTALTQPVHAITVPRGGGPGYPHDRKVYQTWGKPIVVLCNQNSGSNAEIFSHAIKTLKRGPLVGVATAGAVVSTGSTNIMDVGVLRLPTRGWFVIGDGLDMEKNGAAPHHVVWPEPCGRDTQLTKALDVLQAEVAEWQKRPQPKLQFSTER